MKPDEFGKYLKQIRKTKGLTIRQLDLYSGVSHSYLSQIESGKRGKPSPDILRKISKPLGVTYESLMEVAGYIDLPERDSEFWENLTMRIGELREKDDKSQYKDLMMSLFEFVEVVFHKREVPAEALVKLEQELKVHNIDFTIERFKKTPFSSVNECLELISILLDNELSTTKLLNATNEMLENINKFIEQIQGENVDVEVKEGLLSELLYLKHTFLKAQESVKGLAEGFSKLDQEKKKDKKKRLPDFGNISVAAKGGLNKEDLTDEKIEQIEKELDEFKRRKERWKEMHGE